MKKTTPQATLPAAIASSPSQLVKPRAVFKPSPELGKIIGNTPVTRPDALRKLWDYIRKEELQDPRDKREITPDAKLKPVLGDAKVSMFKFTQFLAKHLSR